MFNESLSIFSIFITTVGVPNVTTVGVCTKVAVVVLVEFAIVAVKVIGVIGEVVPTVADSIAL